MPQYPRRRRAWDWLTPVEIKHLPAVERETLMKVAGEAASRDRFHRWSIWVGLVFLVVPTILNFYLVNNNLSPGWLFSFDTFLLFLAIGLILCGNLRQRYCIRRSLRELLLARHICPACCFECGAFTEGYEGTDCPVCGVRLVGPASEPRPE